MTIETRRIEELLPADYNPRKDLKPGDPEYEKLKRSLQQFGYVEPVIWNRTTGRVVGGHQRIKVLKELGLSELECVVVEFDKEHEKALKSPWTRSAANGLPCLSPIFRERTSMYR
jgi:ParB-like chromosome segregation protein Spo0J